MNCKSFEDIFEKMELFLQQHGEDLQIAAIVNPSEKYKTGKYGWKLSYTIGGKKEEEDFVIEIETLKKNNAIEELDAMSNFLLDPTALLTLLRHVSTEHPKSGRERDFERKELLFLAKIEHLKTIKTKE